MAYPALRTTKEDVNVVFSFLWRQFFTSDQAEALEANLLFALGAECLSTPQIASAKETQEGNIKCPSTREDTNLQRPTHVQALSDD